jgi:hypothetical protein
MRRRRNRTNTDSNLLAPLFAVTAKVVFSLVLAVAAGELGAGVALTQVGMAAPAEMPDYRPEDIARLYDTTDYRLYLDALAETWRAAETAYSPFVESAMAPFSGRHVAIDGGGARAGHRRLDAAAPGPKIFVFGGSTTFGMGVPGTETLPSFVEEALRAAGKEAQVVNYGTIGHFSTPERILLERLLADGQKPDVAVFVDGLGDFQHCRSPERGEWSDRLAMAARLPAHLPLTQELAERSQMVRLVRTLTDRGPERRAVMAGCSDDKAVERAAARLDANRRMIAGIADRMGFKVLFVQQPVPSFHYDNAKRPLPLKPHALEVAASAGTGTARMAEMKAAGTLFAADLLWLAELEPAEGNAYIDAVHYSPRLNKAIADAVAKRIIEANWLP